MPTEPDHKIRKLTRQEASDAVSGTGWRYLATGILVTQIPAASLGQSAQAAAQLASAAGAEADGHLQMDIRADRLLLSVATFAASTVTSLDTEVAIRLSAAAAAAGLVMQATGIGSGHTVQTLELAIDAMDIASIRPFWLAVLGYEPEPGHSGPEDAIADPAGQGPTIWFQQMDAPRPQRNRVHFDVSVPVEEADRRIKAAIAAGGTLRYDGEAPAFWLLADPEGNEACVLTWQGRDI